MRDHLSGGGGISSAPNHSELQQEAKFEPTLQQKDDEVHIAIVGAGPRGTSLLERLCASAPKYLEKGTKLTVHVVDPHPAGAGQVWRTSQTEELLMNTVAGQVTLFTDNSVDCEGPIQSGPSLHEWAQEHDDPNLGPDDYPSRAQYGRYLRWVYEEVLRRAPVNIHVEYHAARATSLDEEQHNDDGEKQCLKMSNGRTLHGLSAVMMAQGHLPLQENQQLAELRHYAEEHDLHHIQPANPADVDLSGIRAGETVVLRGLGLNFFDYMALFTADRGGRFVKTEGGKQRYEPSGKEPRLYASSRRGVPYHARGDNDKGPYERHMPLVLTEEVINNFRERANKGDMPDFEAEVWPLVAKEVEVVYYEAELARMGVDEGDEDQTQRFNFRRRFLATAHESQEETQVLDDFDIPKRERFSWDRIMRPYGGATIDSAATWHAWVLNYLREDAKAAARGNVYGPLKASLDAMRDLRNELRLIVDHRGISGASHRAQLDRWYTPLNAYLSIGPPRERIEQMIALIEAGVLEVLGPDMEVRTEDGVWKVSTPLFEQEVHATTLIEARLPDINLRKTGDDLLSHMLQTGQCRPHSIEGHETTGLDVSESPFHVIDANGQAHDRRFAVGVPTEGVHWVTAAGARPGVNSVTLLDTDAVARGVLHIAQKETQTPSVKSKIVSGLSSMQQMLPQAVRPNILSSGE